jgi:dephospho-CoA kinase
MTAFLVTGNPGSGKTTLAAELARRGLIAIDPDDDAELSYWEDDAGIKILKADGPAQPDEQWLRTHHWVWSRSRLQELLSESEMPIFVCGIAMNIHQLVDLFERIFLLRIDADTQEQRLLAYDAADPPGRNQAGRQQIRDGRPIFEAQMLELGAIALDGTAPTATVADQLLAFVFGAR